MSEPPPCRDDPEMFFPFAGQPAAIARAVAVCHTCPVILACREAGRDQTHGVWGGVFRDGDRPLGDVDPKPVVRKAQPTTLGETHRLLAAGMSEKAIAAVLGMRPESVARARQRRAAP